MTELTGKPFSDVMGRKYHEVLPRILADDTDALHSSLKTQKEVTFKGYCFHCLYSRIRADIQIKPVKEGNGKANGLQVHISPAEPCAVVRELHDSQRLIDIGKIASTLAHGVRNPLNVIKGAVVFLRENHAKDSTLVEFTDLMESEISRLDNFISKFLSTSLAEEMPSEVDINSLLKKIEAIISLQVQAYHIETVFEYGKVSSVLMNTFHLEQAILNIMNNAIEAMRAGGRLTVKSLNETERNAKFAVIEISDTGPGMAYNASDMPEAKTNKGKGFGLFITREILKQYNGHLEMRTEKGFGTTARLCLPVSTVREGRHGRQRKGINRR